ncbi:MAG: hypothetical protein FJ044_01215, partial [Candidatus Cloacimonetes bacterium]|nr:hypothetical protein [Candidatus Cloacimonadota bacterium]
MAGDIISQEPYKYSLDYHQFADFLGLDRETKEDFKTAKKVAFIYDWAKEIVGRDDRDTIMSAIRDYQKGLGVNFVGQKLVDYLYQQVRLDMSSGHPKIVEKLSQRQVGAPKEEKGPDLIEKKLEKNDET